MPVLYRGRTVPKGLKLLVLRGSRCVPRGCSMFRSPLIRPASALCHVQAYSKCARYAASGNSQHPQHPISQEVPQWQAHTPWSSLLIISDVKKVAPLCNDKHGLVDSKGHTQPSDVILKVDSSLLCRDPLVELIPPKGFAVPTVFPGPGSRRALVSVQVPGNTLLRTVLASAVLPNRVR